MSKVKILIEKQNNCSNFENMEVESNVHNTIKQRSYDSLSTLENAWKPTKFGIKTISYRPEGFTYLTKSVLELYLTDGIGGIDIRYIYARNYRHAEKVPFIGTSIENCTICETITIDIEGPSTYFALILEVQIITQGKHKNCEDKTIKNLFNINIKTRSDKRKK